MRSNVVRKLRLKRLQEGRRIRRLFGERVLRVRFHNTTDVPLELIKDVYHFTVPPGVTGVSVSVRNQSRGCSGRACGSYKRILVRVGPESSYPSKFTHYKGKGYLDHVYRDRTDALVHLMAHELRHIWQYEHPIGHRVHGSKGQYSERDCDAYGIKMSRAWRKAHYIEPPLFDPEAVFAAPLNDERYILVETGCGESLGDRAEILPMALRSLASWPRHIRKHLKVVPERECEKFNKTYSDGGVREKWRLKISHPAA